MKIRFRHLLIFIVIVLISGSFFLKAFGSNWTAISSDGWGYYAYLPSIFHYADISGESQMADLPQPWEDEAAGRLLLQENGNYLNKYPIGVALLQTPGYVIANAANSIFFGGGFDQYAGPYQFMVLVSGIVACLVGFYFLWKFLSKRFSEKVTIVTLGLIFLTTNIIHYSTYDVSFSHIFSFASFAYLLYLIDDFTLDKKSLFYFLRLGLTFGLIVTVRQTNIIVGLLFLIIAYKLFKNFSLGRIVKEYWKQFLIMGLSAFLVFFIQMLYWKLVTGNWLVFSYQGEYFDFFHPEIFNVLFSFRKGLFLWTPMLLLTVPGIYFMFKEKDKFRFLIPAMILLQIYIVSSWWAWSFGFAFGHRAFTEFIIFFALPFAYFIKWLRHQKKFVLYFFGALFAFLIILNMNSMQQYWRGILNPDGMTAEAYGKIFMKLCIGAIPGQGCEAVR